MIKNSLKLLIVLFVVSCKSNKNYLALDNEISRCIEERVKNDPIHNENFNLVTFLVKTEEALVKSNVLKGNSKSDYVDLFLSLKEKSINKSELNNFIKSLEEFNNYSLIQNSININNTPFECNRFLIEKNKLNFNSNLSEYYNVLTEYFEKGTVKDDWDLNNKMIRSLSNQMFKKVYFRLPFIVLAHDNIIALNSND